MFDSIVAVGIYCGGIEITSSSALDDVFGLGGGRVQESGPHDDDDAEVEDMKDC